MAARKKYVNGAKRVGVWMPLEMVEALDRHARERGVNRVDIIHEALRQALDLEPMVPKKAFG